MNIALELEGAKEKQPNAVGTKGKLGDKKGCIFEIDISSIGFLSLATHECHRKSEFKEVFSGLC